MNVKGIVDTLQAAIEEYGLLETLQSVLGDRVNVRLMFKERNYEEPIGMLDVSIRSINGLNRAEAKNIGDVIDLINNNEIGNVRNLGRKSIMEIKGALLCYAYEHMSEKEKRAFLHDILRRNGMIC